MNNRFARVFPLDFGFPFRKLRDARFVRALPFPGLLVPKRQPALKHKALPVKPRNRGSRGIQLIQVGRVVCWVVPFGFVFVF
jgi:hypothetical protein